MEKSILNVLVDEVLLTNAYHYSIDENVDECTLSVHFDSKVIYQSFFESLIKITPLLEREGFHWQFYIDYYKRLSLMIF